MTGGNVDVCTTHIFYVWYIYLRLVDFYGKWLYHTWMLWAMSMFYWMWLAVWLKLLCWISPEPEELQERIRSSRLSDIFWYIYIYSIKQICRSNLSVSCGLAITCYSQDLVKGDIFCWIELLSQPIKCHVLLFRHIAYLLAAWSPDTPRRAADLSWVKRYGSILQSCGAILLDLQMWNHGPIGNRVMIDMMLFISYHKPAQYLDLLVC